MAMTSRGGQQKASGGKADGSRPAWDAVSSYTKSMSSVIRGSPYAMLAAEPVTM